MLKTEFQELRKAVIEEIVRLAREKYIYPEMGEKIAGQLQANLAAGKYKDIDNEGELAFHLTTDLQAISSDRHWGVIHNPQGAAEQVDPENEPDEQQMNRYLAMLRKINFGFERVERLKGNVGYIDLRQFVPSEYSGETAVAAMNFVANCDALILDLRKNHGGYPSLIQLITSYLVEPEPVHINTFYYRPTDDTQQFWTFPHVPGRRRPDIPVYVLTSNATGSAAEEFAYNLKHMERATLVGETTVGAAHPVTKVVVQGCFDVRLPYGRPINPITGGNWEGQGVEPHIAVPQADALKTAHLHAVEHLLESRKDEAERFVMQWEKEILESEYSPVEIDEAVLARYSGEFGKRTFFIEDGALVYKHQDIPVSWKLINISGTRFRLDEDIKFEFILGISGTSTAVKVAYRDGRPEMTTQRTK